MSINEKLRGGKSSLIKKVTNELTTLRDARMADDKPVGDPQRSYMWEVSFPDSGVGASTENLKFFAKNTGIPVMTGEVVKRWVGGVEYSYSGRDTSARTIRITFWDSQALEAYRYFASWFETTNEGSEGLKVAQSEYKKPMNITMKDNSDTIETFRFEFTDCYPIEVSEVTLSYLESGEMVFDVTFSYRTRSIVEV